jgi:hypothetical protein
VRKTYKPTHMLSRWYNAKTQSLYAQYPLYKNLVDLGAGVDGLETCRPHRVFDPQTFYPVASHYSACGNAVRHARECKDVNKQV